MTTSKWFFGASTAGVSRRSSASSAMSTDASVALSLRLLGGLEIDEAAAAFVVPESTMAKRLVRAKLKLRHNNAPYRIPSPEDLPDRLHAVLTVVYLVYTAGHRSTRGSELIRGDLTAEAIRLARLVHELMPDDSSPTSSPPPQTMREVFPYNGSNLAWPVELSYC